MFNAGFMFQVLGLLAGVLGMVMYVIAIAEKKESFYHRIGKGLLLVQTVSLTFAVAILLYALAVGDFRYEYVASYTDRSLPMVYKLTALWAGQAGSLLFWAWLGSLFIAFEAWRIKDQDKNYTSYVFLMGLFNATFFLFLCTFITTPFDTLPFIPRDGRGMNPMLQNPGMIIHPPLLYIGFVGFIIPFAHAFASCFVRDTSTYWIKTSRPWTLFSWVLLTAGIVLGAWWAYVELGWGGYWAWDPVENASLFPWITATAFIHAAIIYERRSRLKAWSYALVMITFELTIFGTYLTRSGIMTDSVHSFGKSQLGSFFLLFIFITAVVYLIGLFYNRRSLADKEDFNFLSKEGAFFIGILCFTALTLALIFYTMLPVITQNLLNNKMSVQVSSYNLVSIPFFAAIFFLAGVAPLLPYGKAVLEKIAKTYIPVFALAVLAVIIMLTLGYGGLSAIILTFTATMALAGFLVLLFKMLKNGGIASLWKNRRGTGAILIHIGLALMAYGVIYSAFFSYNTTRVLAPYSTFAFHGYTLEIGTVETEVGQNYHEEYVPVRILKDGKEAFTLYPALREYNNNDNIYGEVAYYSMAKGDLYLILEGYDLGQNMIRLNVIFQPLIIWIWVGCILMCVGALYAMTQNSLVSRVKE